MHSTTSLSQGLRPGAGHYQSDYDSVHGLNYGGSESRFSSFQPYHDDPGPMSASHLPMGDMGSSRQHMTEKRGMYAAPREQSKKRLVLILVAVVVVLLIAAAVALPLYFAVIRPKLLHSQGSSNDSHDGSGNNNNSSSSNGNTNGNKNLITWGTDGSVVETENGSNFTYKNKFGGYWVFDPANPANNSARAQSFTPALNEQFKYGVDRIRG
jgi:glucan 1,3-beta-glucosidase